MARPVIPNEVDADWGLVPLAPIPVDGSAPSTPPTPEQQAQQTQAVQADNEVVRAAVAAAALPPPPGGTPITGSLRVTPAWLLWFTKVRERIGSSVASSTTDLETLDAFSEVVQIEALQNGSDLLLADQQTVGASLDDLAAIEVAMSMGSDDPNKERWDDLRGIVSLRTTGANQPSFDVFRGGLRAYAFSNVSMNEAFLSFQLPHSYQEGSDISLHVHWSHNSAVDDGAVVWQAEWAWFNVNEACPVPTTTTASPVSVLGADQYKSLITPIVVMPGAGKKISSEVMVRLFRDPGATGDTTASAGVFLLESDIHFIKDSRGSVSEYLKHY